MDQTHLGASAANISASSTSPTQAAVPLPRHGGLQDGFLPRGRRGRHRAGKGPGGRWAAAAWICVALYLTVLPLLPLHGLLLLPHLLSFNKAAFSALPVVVALLLLISDAACCAACAGTGLVRLDIHDNPITAEFADDLAAVLARQGKVGWIC